MKILFTIVGIVLLCLAGFNVRGPRFAPEWLGFAALAFALQWHLFDDLG